MYPNNLFYGSLLILVIITGCTNATHFRFATTSWTPTAQYNVINININLAYRLSYPAFANVTESVVLRGYNGKPYVGSDVGIVNFGDGSATASPECIVTSVNKKDDWFTCYMTVVKTYPTVVKTYTIAFTGAARISTLLNNHDANYRAQMTVTITPPPGVTYSSPVSGVLPIINVIKGVPNSFQIVSNNAPNVNNITNPLRFTLSNDALMGGGGQVQPQGLSVDYTTGWVTFTPASLGLYTTQITITNGVDYIVADFILNSIVAPKSPPFFFGDTPENGQEIVINNKQFKKWAYQAMSNMSTLSVSMYYANSPVGVQCTPQVGSNPGLINCSWTPTLKDVGSYVVSLGVSDSQGTAMNGQRSFILTVQSPQCGHGTPIPNCQESTCCTCDEGWDPDSNCFECVPGRYGANCTKNPHCFNGTISDGVNGNGVCSCYFGWTGAACNVTVSQFCLPANQTAVNSFTTGQGYLSPKYMLVYVGQSSPAFTLPLSLSVPSTLPSLDVYILLDVATTTDIANIISTYINSFVTTMKTYSDEVRFGLGVFSDAPGGFNYTNVLVLGSTITTTVANYKFTITTTSSSARNGLGALLEASQAAVGWNSQGYHSLLVITDSDCEGPSDFYKTVGQSLIQNSVMPTVLGVGGATMTNWKNFLTSITFGYQDVSTSTSTSDWATRGVNLVMSAVKLVAPFTFDDKEDFITNTIAPFNTAMPKTSAIPFKVTLPSGAITKNQAKASISVPGYGITNIDFTYNHPPVAIAGMLTTTKNVQQSFKFLVSDADSNLMLIKFTSLPDPTIGTVSINGLDVNTTASYSSKSSFVFVPKLGVFNKRTNFGYSVTDGCATVTSTFGISVVDDYTGTPPTALPTLVNTTVNQAVRFTFNFTDTNKPTAMVMLGSLPTNGVFTFINGTVITSSMIGVAIPQTIIYTPKTGMTNDDTVDGRGPLDIVYFSVLNDKGYISAIQAVANIFVKPFHPPTYTGQLEFNTLENTPLTFLLTGKVGTNQDYYTVVFDSIVGRGNISYLMCAELDTCYKLMTAPFVTNPILPSNGKSQLLYVPPPNDYQDKIMIIKLRLVSPNGDATDSITITINVIHVPKPPTIVLERQQVVGSDVVSALASTVSININESVIVSFSSYNFDTPNETLSCIIQSTPRRGNLFVFNANSENATGPMITSGQNLGVATNGTWKVVYRPVPGTSGQGYAKFTFATISTLQLISPSVSILFNVNPVFHPPVITVNQVNWTSLINTALLVTNVTFVSVDVSYQNMTMNVSLSDADGNAPADGVATLQLFGTTAGYCRFLSNTSVSCLASKYQLNLMLSQVTVTGTNVANYQMIVYVENTHLKRVNGLTLSQISDTKSASISLAAGSTRTTTNTTVLSAAIAAAVAAAGLLAAALWRLTKHLSPPTSAFFGDQPFADGAIQDNPIYKESDNAGVNPLYLS
ncbi:hypothetical protein SAMD00019534_050030 [Acytostelium subglobosum LB1]|uniref:hypothetical protein n=1 Tax=Acytostelium subglobosum LB1 TaxID=1410327 RepID=UPI000644F9D2|nr:hypothetical protein SAMD00019534_050030 [Acytostelium subglobosum LB1]GAM21828.1 hypothetical protein SAMD00019534_050030 [Acytostelium subglobosum LB1]|eukprot:XP_012754928.1 hypothetical protein SAMD00019534_050030 [Acytostelium subglobosum LB1]